MSTLFSFSYLFRKTWESCIKNFFLIPLFVLIQTMLIYLTVQAFDQYSMLSFLALLCIMMLFPLFSMIFFALVLDAQEQGKQLSFEILVRETILRIIPFIVTYVLFGIALTFLYMLLILPGIIFTVLWLFFFHALVLRKRYFFQALEYSRHLVMPHWIIVSLFLLLITVVLFLFLSVLGVFAVLYSFNAWEPSPLSFFFFALLGTVMFTFFFAFMTHLFFALEKDYEQYNA